MRIVAFDGLPILKLRTERLAGSDYLVSAAGEIDLNTASPFRAAVTRALDAGAKRLVVDLSECGFLDTRGVRVLKEARARLDGEDQPLTLIADDSCVLLMLEVSGLEADCAVYPSRVAAFEALAA
jgi:anti-sigma B factor antagonist